MPEIGNADVFGEKTKIPSAIKNILTGSHQERNKRTGNWFIKVKTLHKTSIASSPVVAL